MIQIQLVANQDRWLLLLDVDGDLAREDWSYVCAELRTAKFRDRIDLLEG